MISKETSTTALVLVAFLCIFVAVQPLLPSASERFSELGILGPNQTIADYPTNVTEGAQIHLYLYLGNHEGIVQYYQVRLKLGNESTQVSNSTSASAPLISQYSQIIDDNKSAILPIDFVVDQSGTNLRLIFELWSYNETTSSFHYTGLWNQLFVNVTST